MDHDQFIFNNKNKWKPLKLNTNTIVRNLFFIFLKIGRISISTGSPGRSRLPEFKKNNENTQTYANFGQIAQKLFF